MPPPGDAPSDLVAELDARLPQTQCGRCGHAGCGPYAEALAAGRDDPNRCPPGGPSTVDALARLLGRAPRAVEPARSGPEPWQLAVVLEDQCIGCTLCLQACPVDAIVGGPKRMHSVLPGECTGCGLCVAPCPVECIVLRPMGALAGAFPGSDAFLRAWERERAPRARGRFRARESRLARQRAARASRRGRRGGLPPAEGRRAEVAAALARVRARRAGAGRDPSRREGR